MSQRNSGRARVARDAYQTPRWVTEALVTFLKAERLLPASPRIWEPACGHGKMAGVLCEVGDVYATDIDARAVADQTLDFLTTQRHDGGWSRFDAIITNPPYVDGEAFVRHALGIQRDSPLAVTAMLLPLAWDTAKTRADLFARGSGWHTKLTLQSRIRWFDGSTGSPSENHAWFIWVTGWGGRAQLAYATAPEREKRRQAA
jgi:hypothetical protein